jgi:glycosyltransferase involved in cell wall biosynthesis
VILNVGVISRYKQQLEILNVARKLHQRGFQFELQFVGAIDSGSSYGADLLQQLADPETSGFARHIGTLQVNELVAAYDQAAALVHFPAEEAFGLVVAEALARNVKLFAASVGGVPDIAAGVDGAELLAARDWEGLEAALGRWLETGARRPATADGVMRERYHPEVIARRHVEIYREVLASRS